MNKEDPRKKLDPFTAEELRRAEEIAYTDLERSEAITADETQGQEGQGVLDSMMTLSEYRKSQDFPVPEAKALPPRIGAWEPGNHKQDLQALRFEIEAERALQLGRPVPDHDEELRQLHLKLNEAHLAYQRSGDASLLIGLADLKAQYVQRAEEIDKERALREFAEREHDSREAQHLVQCVSASKWHQGATCSRHDWPSYQPEWKKYLAGEGSEKPAKKILEFNPAIQETLRMDGQVARHEQVCMTTALARNFCTEHDWPLDRLLWGGGRSANRPLEDRKHVHARHCISRRMLDETHCAAHGWPSTLSGWVVYEGTVKG